MENKQTAVEWLIDALTDEPNHYLFICEKPDYMEGLINIIQQAKAMEKEQIKDAYDQGDIQLVNAEQYYEETYGKDINQD